MTLQNDRQIAVEISSDNKCSRCTGLCCTYMTQKVETPRSKYDFEHLLWQLAHENVQAYKDEDGWYLLFRSRCNHLLPGGACGIYERRPQICRDYDNDFCEYDEPADQNFELFFDGYDALRAYCQKRFKKWER